MPQSTKKAKSYRELLWEALQKRGESESNIEVLMAQIAKKNKEEYTTLRNILSEASSLPNSVKTVYLKVIDLGKASMSRVSNECDLNPNSVYTSIEKLLKDGYLLKEFDNETKEIMYRPNFYRSRIIFNWEKLRSGPRVPLPHQFPMLCDANRVEGFRKAILNNVRQDDVVVDLGAGTGVLSLFAAEKAKKVYSVEIDPYVQEQGEKIVNKYISNKKIEYILGDARNVILSEKVDVIICEMIDTALVAELQIPVMNHAIKNHLKSGGKVIPYRSVTKVQLINMDYELYGYDFQLPHFEGYGARRSQHALSDEKTFHNVTFDTINSTSLNSRVELEIIDNGNLNGFKIITDLYVDPDTVIRPSLDPHTWLNPPYVVPLEDREVKKCDKFYLSLSYEMGGGWETLKYKIEEG